VIWFGVQYQRSPVVLVPGQWPVEPPPGDLAEPPIRSPGREDRHIAQVEWAQYEVVGHPTEASAGDAASGTSSFGVPMGATGVDQTSELLPRRSA
jgi:hypothetical protein